MTDSYRFQMRVPEGDDRPRAVCDDCGFVAYVNPKIVVGAVCTFEGRILMCRRDIEPRKGFWTIPAGFLEEGESAEQGAIREAAEEALASIRISSLLGVYSIAHISQIYLVYRAELESPEFGAGDETQEAKLVHPDDIPWDELAFESVTWSLERFLESAADATSPTFSYPPLPTSGGAR